LLGVVVAADDDVDVVAGGGGAVLLVVVVEVEGALGRLVPGDAGAGLGVGGVGWRLEVRRGR